MAHTLYQRRYCAFIDILGFSEFIRKTELLPKQSSLLNRQRLLELNNQFEAERAKVKSNCLQAELTYFSDSIFLSIPCHHQDALGQLFYFIQRLTTAVIIQGFLTRGAVVVGNVYHRDSVVFGPAVLEAYGFEQRVANYPRIMVTNAIVRSIDEGGDAKLKLQHCEDGPTCVNCLMLFEQLANEANRLGVTRLLHDGKNVQRLAFLRRVRDFLQAELEASRDNPSVYSKVSWLCRRLNAQVLSRKLIKEDGWPELISFGG